MVDELWLSRGASRTVFALAVASENKLAEVFGNLFVYSGFVVAKGRFVIKHYYSLL